MTPTLIQSDLLLSSVDRNELQDDEILSSAPTINEIEEFEKNSQQITYSYSEEKGFRYYGIVHKVDIHKHMEDRCFPANGDCPTKVHPLTHRPYSIFCLADGHGGHNCSSFLVTNIPQRVSCLIESREWRFPEDEPLLRESLSSICIELDQEYCSMKFEEFRKWLTMVRSMQHPQNDPYSANNRTTRPADDGSTLTMNIILEGYLINCNVGDSRSILLNSTSKVVNSSITAQNINVSFSSEDHNPGHPRKAYEVFSAGGRFLFNGTTINVSKLIQHPENRGGVPYETLSNYRIARPFGWILEELDFPSTTTLNLAGTFGDLFFKHGTPLLHASPDIHFVKLEEEKDHILIMSTDGVFDHMIYQDSVDQNSLLCYFVLQEILKNNSLPAALKAITSSLCDRQGTPQLYGSYTPPRFDDCSCFCIHIKNKK
jgi:serine/threonine protein phosphatase PrpC